MTRYRPFVATENFSKKLIYVVTLLAFSTVANAAQVCFSYTGAIENWPVPAGVTTITAEASGAQGGDSTWSGTVVGGLGATMIGDVTVTPGDQLQVLVGGQGESLAVGGGGGGSFLATSTNGPLLVAGGGGGASSDQTGVGAVTTENGTSDSTGSTTGGIGGNGGNACLTNTNNGGGGGGFFTNGADPSVGGTIVGGYGGIAFVNGGTIVPGGRIDGSCNADPAGGFGGGGSATCNTVGGGGGGGYSGGGGGEHFSNCSGGAGVRAGGGGGGSFNSGINQSNTAATRAGNGEICITYPDIISYTIGGTVSGLIGTGTGLVLQNNGGDDLIVAADGSFTFILPINVGNTYDVTIWAQPESPLQICSVTNGTGTVVDANVIDVNIECILTLPAMSIPALSVWGMGILIGLFGFFVYRRRLI